MEGSIAAQVEVEEEATRSAEPAAVNALPHKLFKASAYVNVGEGAEACEHQADGECDDREHFHAWCRLPNSLQHEDIREKAFATKARRMRALRDPNTDAHITLEGELYLIDDPSYTESIVDALLEREWPKDFMRATREVNESEDYKHIAQDREEYQRLLDSEGDKSDSEYSQELRDLQAHVAGYMKAQTDQLAEIQGPRRAELRGYEFPRLMEMIRRVRVEADADKFFMDAYQAWLWFTGTYDVKPDPVRGRPFKLKWLSIGRRDGSEPGTLHAESPEVVEAIKDTFNELSAGLRQGSAGN
jgi:hypothetical protein